MGWYEVFKFLHIVTATAWVGGGILLAVAAGFAQRSPGPVFSGFSAVAARLGAAFFMPMSLLTLVSGVIVTAMAWSFAELWIILALVGIAATIGIGMTIIKPTTDRIAELAQKEGPDSPAVRALSADLLRKGRFDQVVLVVIIADMVFKPSYGDLAVLVVMAAAIIAAAFAFLIVKPGGTLAPAA